MIKMTQILNELQGVSFDSRVWQPIIRRLIDDVPHNLNPGDYVFGYVEGYDHPPEHRRFPLDHIEVRITKSDEDEGEYSVSGSGYDKDTEYNAYLSLTTSASDATIFHELKHAYNDFKIKERQIDYPKKKKNYNQGDFSKLIQSKKLTEYGPFGYLMWGIYYTSDDEIAARIEEIYTNPESANRIIRETNNILKVYITDRFIRESWSYFGQHEYYREINRDFDIPILKRYSDFQNFIRWAQNEIKYNGEKALKRFLKVKYLAQTTNITVNPD